MAAAESESNAVQPDGVQFKSPVRAWLETSRGKFPLHGGCSIGRSPKNAIVLDWPKVSRRHAIINVHDGVIDKYLGDGFFAYWREDKNSAKNVAATLDWLKKAQARNEPRFRLALHFGLVAIGGMPSMGEESLMGKEVNFVFRMEKLAGSLKISVLTSAAGESKLKSLLTCAAAGAHELKGFEGKFEFFSC